MSGHQFVFPPPPPPPPPPPQSTPNHTKQGQPPTVQGVGYHGRGNRGDRPFRGRGRGNDRGGFRGGHDGDVGRSASQRNEGHFSFGYSPHGSGTAGGYPLPEYPPVQQPQYPANFESGYGHQTSHYPPAFAPPAPNRGYNDGPPKPLVFDGSWQNTNYTHKPPAYDVSYPHQELQNFNARPARPNHKVKPVVAGPPIHIAFQGDYKGVYQQAPFPAQAHPQPYQNQPNSYPPAIGLDSQSPFQQTPHATLFPNTRDPSNPSTGNRNRGQKRGHYDAFGRSRSSNPKTNAKSQVAPSVPSFGIPLPVKPPAPQETGRKSRKKKRRHNQLGLTPKTVEYESSEEEENDADEEAKLAAEAGIPGIESEQLQFVYKGQKSTLQSSDEIAVWLEERKKRYPTKARQEENRKRLREQHELHRAAKQDRDATIQLNAEAKEKQKADVKIKRKEEARAKQKVRHRAKQEEDLNKEQRIGGTVEKDANSKANSSAVKAKLKVEKLKRKLEKEERRVAKAEAKMVKLKAGIGGDGGAQDDVKKRKRSESPGNQNNSILYSSEQVKDETVTSSLNIGNASLKELEADLVQSEGKNNVGEDLKQDDPDSGSLEASSKMLDPLTPTSQPSLLEPPDLSSERDQSPHAIENVNPADEIATIHQHAALGSMDSPKRENDNSPQSPHDSTSSSTLSSSSMLTDSDDETSSDDSSSGASSSSVPECRPSTRTQPDKVAPPKRAQSRTICRNFLQHGRCYKGRGCRFRHELPERGNLAMMQRRQQKHARRDRKAQRVSLHQRLVAQEYEREMQEAAAASKRSDEARIQADVMRASDATTAPMAVDRDGCN